MTKAELLVVAKLVKADVRQRPGRLALTVLSTIAAACVVVWVVSGYDSLVQKFKDLTEKYLGRYELFILPASDRDDTPDHLTQDLISSLQQDPVVATVDRVCQTHAKISAKPSAHRDSAKAKSSSALSFIHKFPCRQKITRQRHDICARAEGRTNLPKQHGAKSCAKELPTNLRGSTWGTNA